MDRAVPSTLRIAAGLALALAVCGSPRAQAETIALFTKSQGSPIFAALRAGATTAGRTLGVEVIQYLPSTGDTVVEQNKLVDDAIKDKPAAIIFDPIDYTKAQGAVDKINAAHIPLFNVNERLKAGDVAGYVGIDDAALARDTARYLLKALNGKGGVVILDGPDGNRTAQGRAQGFRDAIKEFPDVKLLAGKSANYARPTGQQVTAEFLRSFPQLDGILAANDPMAIGAVDALKASGRKAQVAGINASREAMDLIKSGAIIASGDYDSFAMGCIALEMAVRSLRKEDVPKEVMLKPLVVDKGNLAPFDQPYDKRECPALASVAGR